MDIFIAISNFIYRIRYKLLVGALVAGILSAYFTGFLPKRYNVQTTLFTGISSTASIDNLDGKTDWNGANNAHDNIINLVKSKSTLEAVSLKLLTQHLMYGDPHKDNKYISAAHYRDLIRRIPKDVQALIDKSSFDKTLDNLRNYRVEDERNFVYGSFYWKHPHYSYLALSKIKALRKGASDMIEITYQSNDPGITANTLTILNKEVSDRYEGLLLNASNDVVRHFEEQLAQAVGELSASEDSLVRFNVDNNIINYEEQTKHLVLQNNNYETRLEQISMDMNSSLALVKELEHQMEVRTKLVRENETFLNTLSRISTLNGQIAEIEIFGSDVKNNTQLAKNKAELAAQEEKIAQITDQIDTYKFSKEGVVVTDMVGEWLRALLQYEKSRSEMEVMQSRKAEIDTQYKQYTPVGPNLGRHDRTVSVNEQKYITILHHLGLAKLKQKNILLDAGSLQVVTPPEFPLLTMPRKRHLIVFASVAGVLIFIFSFYLLIELMDRTVRDAQRAKRLTGGEVIGAFPTNKKLQYRRYAREVQRMAIAGLANILNGQVRQDKKLIINLLSIRPEEGKSFIAEHLTELWQQMGFAVSYVSHHVELNSNTKELHQASSIYQLIDPERTAQAEIILVEYVALNQHNVPDILLHEADINLLILDAERAWMQSDRPIFDHLRKVADGAPVYIYLNYASREVVEQFTGQLPPYTQIRKIGYKLFNFGITAKK